ncbi:hypothetical protein CVS40_10624 [Lucilia cuprina]|nr:hypothetical protein CVS40_10624 [Lucilia cuprina]
MFSIKFTIFKLFAATTLIWQLIYANKLYENQQQPLQHDRIIIYKKFLQQIEKEEFYKTCVIFGKPIEDFHLEEILQKDLEKLIVLRRDLTNKTKCCGYHTKFLTVIYWHKENFKDLVKIMADILRFKRYNKLVIIKNAPQDNVKMSEILDFFYYCKLYKFPNLVLIFQDFHIKQNLYQYQIFPNLTTQKLNLNDNPLVMFPNKFKNLYGAAVRTMPDQILPRTAAFIDKSGGLQTNYINGTLLMPFNITVGKTLFYEDIYNLTQHELIDIPASLTNYVLLNNTSIITKIYEINKWCIIVPIEPPLTYQDYLERNANHNFITYFMTLQYIFSILLVLSTKLWSLCRSLRFYTIRFNDILMNLNIVSGMFGGSFKLLPNPSKSLRVIYISTFLSGLTFSIIISTRMQVFLTYPYTYRIRSLKDLSYYNLRVLIPRNDYQYMVQYYNFSSEHMTLIFKVAQDYEEFTQAQSSLNTSYAYPISSSLWFMFNALQTYTNKPIFRLTQMCFPNTSLMAFVLPPDSLFMESLNRLITRVRDMGLLEFWLKTSCIDLVTMKKIYLQKDRIVIKKSTMLELIDFSYLWLSLLRYFIMAFLVFLGEILWYRFWNKRNK